MEISRWREPPVLAPKTTLAPTGASLIVAAIEYQPRMPTIRHSSQTLSAAPQGRSDNYFYLGKYRSRRPERCHSPQDQRERVSALSHAQIYWQVAPVIEMLSIHHPAAAAASSDPMRQRSVIVCPATFGPRSIAVLI